MESATLTRVPPGSNRLERLRSVPASTWAKVGFALMCAVALFGYFAYPTYPTYDSFYALLWGRDLLHAHLPDFRSTAGRQSTRWRSPSACCARSSARAARA